MEVESIAIESISSDPANARQHSPKNLAAIKASLRRFGQQKPIVVDSNNIVRAGNGTLEAAKSLGWKSISVVRSDLVNSEATAYAIADNRTGELAEWDKDVLAAQLGSLQEEDFDLSEIGFDAKDIARLLGDDDAESGESMGEERWMVVVTCKNEADQVRFLEQMKADGRECRALLG